MKIDLDTDADAAYIYPYASPAIYKNKIYMIILCWQA